MNITTIKSLACISALIVAGPVAAAEDNTDSFINYSFVEGAYLHNNFNPNGLVISDRDGVGDTTDDNFGRLSDATGTGGAGRFSLNIFKGESVGMHVVGDYLTTSHNAGIDLVSLNGATATGILDTQQEELRFALGINIMASKNFSLFAELGIVNSKVSFSDAQLILGTGGTATADISSASGSRSAVDAKIGFRAMVTDHFELTGYGRYNGNGKLISDGDGGVGFSGKVEVGAGGFYHFNKNIALGGDYEFGKPGRFRLVARVSF